MRNAADHPDQFRPRTIFRLALGLGVASTLVFGGIARAEDTVLTTAIPGVTAPGIPIVFLKRNMTSSEGPVAAPDGGIYFTEPTVNKIYKVAPDDTITTVFDAHKIDDPKGERWRMPSLAMDAKGVIYACRRAGGKIGVAVVLPEDKARFVADNYKGVPFGAPNDLSVARDGGIYFTDPGDPGQGAARPHNIYYIKPTGEVVDATDQLQSPNGLVLSRDEKTLYAVDSKSEYVYAFEVAADHTLKNRRNFAHLKGFETTAKGFNNGIDGMAIDNDGRVYVITLAGLEVFTPKGEALGIIPVPVKAQNLVFGGKDGHTLYVVGHGNLYKIPTLSQKFTGRAK